VTERASSPPSPASRRGLSAGGAATLAAIASVLVLVSLPRLRGFALHENEQDALETTRLLARAVADARSNGAGAAGAARDVAIGAIAGAPPLARQLRDAEVLADGQLLRRHGYLFEVVAPGEGAGLAVRAWPWRHGRTGRIALVGRGDGEVLANSNADGRWSGPLAPPTPPSSGPLAEGWRPL
jgi:hypothetical protein